MTPRLRRDLGEAAAVGRRVFLRPPRAADQDELIRLNRASVRLHRGLVCPPRRPEQYRAFLARSRRPNQVALLVCGKSDGAVMGAINVSEIVRGNFRSAYLGYYMGAAHAGQGHMTEALRLTIRHAFRVLELHRVEANIQPGNTASIRLVKRAGFRREGFSPRYLRVCGRWRDHERWALVSR
jgi:ribosomal-protein-alanine N-acetyltransferase